MLGPTNIQLSSTPARSAPQEPAFCSSSWSSLESSSSRSEAASLQPVFPNILIANFQGITSKVAELSILIDTHKVDIISACETHLTPDIRNSELFSSDFTVYCKNRNHCGGGILIAVKNNLASLPHPDLDANCEIVWAEVIFEGESLLICSFYRLPSGDEATLNELDISLKKAVHLPGNRHILVGGDLYLPSINWNTLSEATPARDSDLCDYHLDIVQDCYLKQLVLEPTRRGATTSKTLDLLLTSKPGLINDVQIIPGLSDHDHVVATANKCVQVPSQKIRRNYNFGKGNLEGFSRDIAQLAEHFQLTFHIRSVNENWSLFKNAILLFADNHFPLRAARPGKPNSWFNRFPAV